MVVLMVVLAVLGLVVVVLWFAWVIGLLIYGYKKGYLGCINKDWEPGDFFMMPHYHHHDVHVDVHEHHDYWHP